MNENLTTILNYASWKKMQEHLSTKTVTKGIQSAVRDFIDYLVLSYDGEDDEKLVEIERFIQQQIFYFLTCGECASDSDVYLLDQPVDLSSQEAFAERAVDFHNHVNCKLNREEWSIERYADKLLAIVERVAFVEEGLEEKS